MDEGGARGEAGDPRGPRREPRGPAGSAERARLDPWPCTCPCGHSWTEPRGAGRVHALSPSGSSSEPGSDAASRARLWRPHSDVPLAAHRLSARGDRKHAAGGLGRTHPTPTPPQPNVPVETQKQCQKVNLGTSPQPESHSEMPDATSARFRSPETCGPRGPAGVASAGLQHLP